MSRRHPTQPELDKKGVNIAAEAAKTSNFRPRIIHKNPNDPFTPGETEKDSFGLIVGENKPVLRDVPSLKEIVAASRYRHDKKGLCTRPDCVFKNATPEQETQAKALRI